MDNGDKNYGVVQEMYRILWITFDFEKFKSLFAENAEISYDYNDQLTKVKLEEFFERMKKGHFYNVTNVKVLKQGIERAANENLFLTYYEAESDRKGNGRDEEGPGRYLHTGSGGIMVENGLIISFNFSFEKKKL